MRLWPCALVLLMVLGPACAEPAAAAAPEPPAAPAKPPAGPAPLPPLGIAQRFEVELEQLKDLEYKGLERALALKPSPPVALGFDVRRAKYFERVAGELKLTPEEKGLLTRNGVVSVDHQQRYSMGSAYFAIYARELPVLVTADSVLHALHRSYDKVLQELEQETFSKTIDEMLTAVSAEIARAARAKVGGAPAVRASLEDVDLYVTVARNLMAGAGAPADEPAADRPKEAVPVPPRLARREAVEALLAKIRELKLDTLGDTRLRGGARAIDYSQFRPRGHYTLLKELRRYFRTMMWLGRPDVGFVLQPPTLAAGLPVDTSRERRAAATFVLLLQLTRKLEPLQAMSRLIDFLVGTADDLSIEDLAAALRGAQVRGLEDLADGGNLDPIVTALAGVLGARGQIRGQALGSNAEDTQKTPPPKVFQVFGQRFGLDSFVLSQMVFDSIVFRGAKQMRMMPSGLDVMAAFGNDAAVALLKPQIERDQYAANLLAARRIVDREKPERWNASAYGIWLDALRLLDDLPSGKAAFPRAMRGEPWRRKQLQAQLASWTELRHDTVLYLKQSYGAVPLCGYPTGYVEPYPELFARIGFLARQLSLGLKPVDQRYAPFWDNFAARMADLEKLARKELNAKPFTPEEATFVKRTIVREGGGCGPPRVTGWYAELFLDGQPEKWSPVVTDVHTDPASGNALEEAVGDTNFLVVAIDNQKDRAVYVGPAYSYYELRAPVAERMTNEFWQKKIAAGDLPPRPDWTRLFQPRAVPRALEQRPYPPRPPNALPRGKPPRH